MWRCTRIKRVAFTVKIRTPLFPSIYELRVKLELALALLALRILLVFFLVELNLPTETTWAFEVRKHFLYMAPLLAWKFHNFPLPWLRMKALLIKIICRGLMMSRERSILFLPWRSREEEYGMGAGGLSRQNILINPVGELLMWRVSVLYLDRKPLDEIPANPKGYFLFTNSSSSIICNESFPRSLIFHFRKLKGEDSL